MIEFSEASGVSSTLAINTMKKAKMICPRCGAEMNHHADKVDYDADDALSPDPAFDGIIEEVHTCPNCGFIALRQA